MNHRHVEIQETDLCSERFRARFLVLFALLVNVHPWQIFLAVCAIPSLVGGGLLMLFPESPKFLMSQGRNIEALESFKKIYALNKRKSKESYPIKALIHEVPQKSIQTLSESVHAANLNSVTSEKDKKSIFYDGLHQLRPLFKKPYLGLSIRVYIMNFCILLGQNTIRLWLPQLFASTAEFEAKFGTVSSMCDILEYSANKTALVDLSSINNCEVVITAGSYTNNIIVAATTFCGYLLAGSIVNLIGTKYITVGGLFIAGTAGISLHWSTSSTVTIIISSIFVTMGSISSTSVISSSVSLFPTALRTMIVSLAMMFGRMGSLLGNILFPLFISVGCIPPFLMICCVMFVACIFSAFLPNTKKTTLK